MTEKWARQSHKAFPPCLAQRVQYADDRVQFCIIAALDQPDVSGCTGMTDKYLSKVADFATFKIHEKQKSRDRTSDRFGSKNAGLAYLVLSRLSGDLLRVPIGSVMDRAYSVCVPPLSRLLP